MMQRATYLITRVSEKRGDNSEIYPQCQLRRVDHLPGNARLVYSTERNSIGEVLREAVKRFSPTLFRIHTSFVDFP